MSFRDRQAVVEMDEPCDTDALVAGVKKAGDKYSASVVSVQR